MDKEQILNEREALIEMYKAGFLDGYSCFNKPRKDKDWLDLNKAYKEAFMKRFEKKLTKALKKKEKERCKEDKKNGRNKNK